MTAMTAAAMFFFQAALLATAGFTLIQLATIGRYLMATQADVDKLTAQVLKVRGEIQNIKIELAAVKQQPAAENIDLSALEAAVQAADDENADSVVEAPAEEAVADAPVE